MKKLMVCAAFSLVPLFACMEASNDDPEPQEEEAAVEQSISICCIDYVCPDDEFTTTGCKTGVGPTIKEAYNECNANCVAQCEPSGLYCE